MDYKPYILDVVDDLVSDFLYYDRKEDDTLPMGIIDDMVNSGVLSIDELTDKFRESLMKGIK